MSVRNVFRLLAMCTIGAALATASIAWAQTWTQYDYPGASGTFLNGGPNPQGVAVGTWFDSTGFGHGFVLQNGVGTSFDDPSASTACPFGGTFPAWIDPQGTIVGSYYDSGCAQHAFILKNGQFTT